MKLQQIFRLLSFVFISLVAINTHAQEASSEANQTSPLAAPAIAVSPEATDLVQATRDAKAKSEQLLKSQEEELTNAKAKLGQLRQLVADGLVAQNELVQAEQKLTVMEGNLKGTRQQITEAEKLIAGLLKREEEKKEGAKQPPVITKYRSLTSPTVLRYSGSSAWSIGTHLPQLQSFFTSRFGRPLPVSTIGQSATHNRLGWDHRHAVDVGLHPDSAEGKALIAYLQSNGIPFLAFRGAVPGVSTGPHIHIGTPSQRLG